MPILTKLIRSNCLLALLAGGLSLAGGCLSTPRDFSSPPTTLKIVGENGAPLSGVKVSRHWDDSDCNLRGSETNQTDLNGTVRFPPIPADVGLFTGAWRKAHDNLAPRGSASGTCTSLRVYFFGAYDMAPKDSPLHMIEATQGLFADKDGVDFYTSVDGRSNSMT